VSAEMSLIDYAASGKGLKKPGTQCWVCGIPERDEIDRCLREGMSVGVILRWLLDVRHYPSSEATRNKVQNHRNARHHERNT
jgi:hypothetical protein